MSLLNKLCCCCSYSTVEKIQYEEVTLDGVEDEESGWEFDIGGSASSDEEFKEMNLHMFIDSSEGELSVDDEEYYRSYVANIHSPEKRLIRTRSIADTIAYTKRAQHKTNECMLSGMRRQEYDEIRTFYEEALAACPMRHKHRIIKEYEAFKELFTLLSYDIEDYNKAMYTAERHWDVAQTNTDLETQQESYRYAIMCVPDMKLKARWKQEYNAFLKEKIKV